MKALTQSIPWRGRQDREGGRRKRWAVFVCVCSLARAVYTAERKREEGGGGGVPITSFTILTFEWLPLLPHRSRVAVVCGEIEPFSRKKEERERALPSVPLGFHSGSTAFPAKNWERGEKEKERGEEGKCFVSS